MRIIPRLILTLLAIAILAPASSAADTLEELQADFGRLYRSLQNSRGMGAEDRPAVEAFRDRAEAFAGANPDEAGAVALALQLSLWLKDDETAAGHYQRLAQLRPDDPRLALSWLAYRQADADEEGTFAAYRDLYGRFPNDETVVVAYGRQLKQRALYADIVEVMTAFEPDPSDHPEPAFLLADAQFAQHQFADALATIEAIDTAAITDFKLRSEVLREVPFCQQYVEAWTKEQTLRATETEADDLPRAVIETVKGRVVVELFENEAPNTVANFISLAESAFWDGTRFHRYEPDFMIQGGDPLSREGTESGTPGTGDPGYYIPDEHTAEEHRLHFGDSLAMAKRSAPNSGGCQFYLNHRPTPWLNGKHTVFGRILEGLDVARSLRKDDAITSVKILRKRDHEYEPQTLPKEETASGDAS